MCSRPSFWFSPEPLPAEQPLGAGVSFGNTQTKLSPPPGWDS